MYEIVYATHSLLYKECMYECAIKCKGNYKHLESQRLVAQRSKYDEENHLYLCRNDFIDVRSFYNKLYKITQIKCSLYCSFSNYEVRTSPYS